MLLQQNLKIRQATPLNHSTIHNYWLCASGTKAIQTKRQ